MLASARHGTSYIGVTSHLPSRIAEHREGRAESFTKRYGVKRLVWYEPHERMTLAIQREKALKKYRREWKVNLIEEDNPDWDDLYPNLVGMNRQSLPG
jgi:putative endonuclease